MEMAVAVEEEAVVAVDSAVVDVEDVVAVEQAVVVADEAGRKDLIL